MFSDSEQTLSLCYNHTFTHQIFPLIFQLTQQTHNSNSPCLSNIRISNRMYIQNISIYKILNFIYAYKLAFTTQNLSICDN